MKIFLAGFLAATRFACLIYVGWLLLLQSNTTGWAQVNIWTNDASGKWESPNWLLGVLPADGQSIQIITPGWKAVTIDAETTQDFPGTLTVGTLLVQSYSDSVNTLLLNYADTALPLRVLNGLTIGGNGVLMNLHSGLIVDGGGLNLVTGKLIQDGGFLITTNTSAFLTGIYELTNGILQVSNIYLGGSFSGELNQYGGTAIANGMQVGDRGNYTDTGSGTYALHGGTLIVGGIFVGGQNTYSPFTQNGGTNLATSLTIGGLYNQARRAEYFLNGGTLATSNTTISGTLSTEDTFFHCGGTHVVSNRLALTGVSSHGLSFYPGRYLMTGGDLIARSFWIDSYSMLALTNGNIFISEGIELHGLSLYRETSFLAGGKLACSNVTYSDPGVHLTQTGGALIVSNLFSFGGTPHPYPPDLATYNFAGGTLTASNIEMNSVMVIGENGQSRRIANPGYFQLGGSLIVSNADEQLGRFILASNSTINLAGDSCKLTFANSSNENWTNSARLLVRNWNGSTNGGGSNRLSFGNDASGLTTEQLSQIRFVNPVGLPGGTNCNAMMLATGEVVPVIVWPCLTSAREGRCLVLTWPATCVLQASTNVSGPFLEYPDVPCPLTIDTSFGSQWFFRVRQPY